MELLLLFGFVVGVGSGFFGFGGGTILVPLLMMAGYGIKEAVGMSIVQMVFSSASGSVTNFKKGNLEVVSIGVIILGGLIGAFSSVYIVNNVSELFLQVLFLIFALLATLKLFISTPTSDTKRHVPLWIRFVFGLFLGAMSLSIGIGGALFLTPFLVGFMGFSLKQAISTSLFYTFFSSASALISWSFLGNLHLEEGITIGIASLVGVQLGIYLGHKTNAVWHKALLIAVHILVLGFFVYRTFLASTL